MALLPKIGGTVVHQPVVTPKASTSRKTKRTAVATGKTPTKVTRKPTLTKKGQGSFTVLGAPRSKVNLQENPEISF